MADRSFKNLGAKLANLKQACDDRATDAEALFQAGRYASSMAMALYSLEIALKVQACKRLDLEDLPEAFRIHELEGLLVLSGLKRTLEGLGDSAIKRNWEFLASRGTQQINDLRYKPSSGWEEAEAREFLGRLTGPDGILTWIKLRS